ncbi:MAG: hypothetical protein Q8O14_10940 [bacterium]|nr:hypothetical protein [bacterium]
MKKEIPLLIAFLLGTWMILENFLTGIPRVGQVKEVITNGGIVIMAFTYVLGIYSIVSVNVTRIRRGIDVVPKIALLTALVLMVSMGFWRGIAEGSPFNWLYLNLYVPLQATMFSLLAFYIASAAFRAFRARSVEATLLLVCATLVMVGRIPLGEKIWSAFPAISDWIMNFPNLAGKRAIMIGAALGAISTGLRVILGLERSYLGGE